MRINLFSPVFFEKWDYRNSVEKGIGGSETCHVELAWRFARRGHEVHSYAPIPDDCPKEWKGTHWHKLEEADWSAPGIWILFRQIDEVKNFLPKKEDQKVWLFLEDEGIRGTITDELMERVDEVVTLCRWHYNLVNKQWPKLGKKAFISSNGIKVDLIREIEKEGLPKRNPKKLIYASSPDRGLLSLLSIFKRARERVSDLELHCFYGIDNIEKLIDYKANFGFYRPFLKDLKKAIDQPGVIWRGRVSQNELYREWFSAGIWANPEHFEETSCITCMEAQALGAIPITNPHAALVDNVGFGIFIEGDPRSDKLIQARYVDAIVKVANNEEVQESIRKDMMLVARIRFNWERIIDQLECKVLDGKGFWGVQWAFQNKYVEGKILNLGCADDAANLKFGRGSINVDISYIHPTLGTKLNPDFIIDMRNLPELFYNNFDTVVIGDVLEHMTHEDGILSLSNAKKCLRKGGRVVITIPHDDRNLKEDVLGAPVLEEYCPGVSGRHRLLTREELEQEIDSAGLSPIIHQEIDYTFSDGLGVVVMRKEDL